MTKWSFFKSGWRPLLGWLSLLIIFGAFIVHPTLLWAVSIFGIPITPPLLDSIAIMNIVALILGVGTLRTVEKLSGVNDRYENDRYSNNMSDRFGDDRYGDNKYGDNRYGNRYSSSRYGNDRHNRYGNEPESPTRYENDMDNYDGEEPEFPTPIITTER